MCNAGIDAFCQMLFVHNFVHGDLHPGNVFITTGPHGSPKLAFLDAGIVVRRPCARMRTHAGHPRAHGGGEGEGAGGAKKEGEEVSPRRERKGKSRRHPMSSLARHRDFLMILSPPPAPPERVLLPSSLHVPPPHPSRLSTLILTMGCSSTFSDTSSTTKGAAQTQPQTHFAALRRLTQPAPALPNTSPLPSPPTPTHAPLPISVTRAAG